MTLRLFKSDPAYESVNNTQTSLHLAKNPHMILGYDRTEEEVDPILFKTNLDDVITELEKEQQMNIEGGSFLNFVTKLFGG